MHETFRRPLAGVAAVLLLAACARAEAGPSSAPAAATVVEIVAMDYAFQAPAEIPAGLTTFRLVNRGSELHHAALVRLDAGRTVAELVTALQGGALPSWAREVGGPNAPDPHGGLANLTTVLQPGQYALVCFVDMPGGVPHFVKGMIKPLRVTGAVPTPAPEAPAPTVTMRLDDYHFGLSAPLTRGTQVIRVENVAAQSHEVELVRLAPGKTVEDLFAWFQAPQGPPRASAIGGVAGLARGESGTFEVELTPGTYALLCFLPDAGDRRPHFAHGMVQTVVIE